MIYNTNEQLVTELKKLLLDTKFSQRDISKKMGISPQAFQNLLNKKQLSFADMKRILDCVNCDLLVSFSMRHITQQTDSASTVAINTQQEKSPAAEPKATKSQTVYQEPPKPESEAPHTSQKKPERQFKPFTESDAEKIDIARLPKDIKYQMDIAEVYGMDVLASLLDKARMKAAEATATK